MIANRRCLSAIACLLLGSTGCGPWRSPLVADDVRPTREQRMLSAVKDFEQRRNDAQIEAARSFLVQHNLQSCRQQLDPVLARAPEHPAGLRLRVELLLAEGHLDQADEALAKARAKLPDDADLRELQARLNAPTRPTTGTAAEATVSTTGSSEPMLLPSVNRPVVSIASEVVTATQEPIEPAEGLRRAEADFTAGARESAASILRMTFADTDAEEQFVLRAAVLALRHNEARLAAELASDAVERFSESAPLHRALGVARFRTGEFPAARTALERSLQLDRSSPVAHYFLAATLENLGERAAADSHFRQAATLDARYGRP